MAKCCYALKIQLKPFTFPLVKIAEVFSGKIRMTAKEPFRKLFSLIYLFSELYANGDFQCRFIAYTGRNKTDEQLKSTQKSDLRILNHLE